MGTVNRAGAGNRHSLSFYYFKVKFSSSYVPIAIGIQNTFNKLNVWLIFLLLPKFVKNTNFVNLPLLGFFIILLSFLISIFLKYTPPHFKAEYQEPMFTIKNISLRSWINVGAFIIIATFHFLFTIISSSYLQDNFNISGQAAGYIIVI